MEVEKEKCNARVAEQRSIVKPRVGSMQGRNTGCRGGTIEVSARMATYMLWG